MRRATRNRLERENNGFPMCRPRFMCPRNGRDATCCVFLRNADAAHAQVCQRPMWLRRPEYRATPQSAFDKVQDGTRRGRRVRWGGRAYRGNPFHSPRSCQFNSSPLHECERMFVFGICGPHEFDCQFSPDVNASNRRTGTIRPVVDETVKRHPMFARRIPKMEIPCTFSSLRFDLMPSPAQSFGKQVGKIRQRQDL